MENALKGNSCVCNSVSKRPEKRIEAKTSYVPMINSKQLAHSSKVAINSNNNCFTILSPLLNNFLTSFRAKCANINVRHINAVEVKIGCSPNRMFFFLLENDKINSLSCLSTTSFCWFYVNIYLKPKMPSFFNNRNTLRETPTAIVDRINALWKRAELELV